MTHVLRCALSFLLTVLALHGPALRAQGQVTPPPTVQQMNEAHEDIDTSRRTIVATAVALNSDGLTSDEREEILDLIERLRGLLVRARSWLATAMRYPEIYGQSTANFSALMTLVEQDIATLERMLT